MRLITKMLLVILLLVDTLAIAGEPNGSKGYQAILF